MKRILSLFGVLVLLCSLAACSIEQPETTTKFENMSSVFATVKVLNTFGTVAGYEENDKEVYVLVYSEQLKKTLRMLVTERTRFAGVTGEKYESREIGWDVEVISEYNPPYLTDFYPLSYVWLLPEDSTDPSVTDTGETRVELPPDSIFRFLSESNNATLLDGAGMLAPGELVDPAYIPQPDQDRIGAAVRFTFDQPASETLDHVAFHYLRNNETGREVTVVVVGNVNFPLLMVLKTEFGSADAMLECVREGSTFEAQITAMVNVTNIEGCIYMRNAVLLDTGLADQETVDLEQAQELNGAQYIGFYSSDQPLQVKGIYGSEISAALTENLHVFWKVYERFGLTELLYELLGSDFAI